VVFEWRDGFTGRRYGFTKEQQDAARRLVAGLLEAKLKKEVGDDLRALADAAAAFWARDYYRLVFPLAFGREVVDGGVRAVFLDDPGDRVDQTAVFRRAPLDGAARPPLLPAGGRAPAEYLLADVVLVRAALANIYCRQRGVDPGLLHVLRLACFTGPLAAELAASGFDLPEEVRRLVDFLEGDGEPPAELDAEDLRRLWEAGAVAAEEAMDIAPASFAVTVVVGAVQRVKQYVFETPGLNEIRGGSEILSDVTERLAVDVATELGAEVVLRAAGSHLEFLVPDAETGAAWEARLRREFVAATGGVLVAAAAETLPVRDLLGDYYRAMGRVYQRLEAARNQTRPLYPETLPFEERCAICGQRAAEGWYQPPEGDAEPICRVCLIKREWGRDARRDKTRELEEQLRGGGRALWGLGADAGLPQSLDDLIVGHPRRRLVAVVYGDGNNFGAVVQQLKNIAVARQWTCRVEAVTWSATALALAEAVRVSVPAPHAAAKEAQRKPSLPFQVLALGGEDIGLFAWGPVGLRFAERFVALTDREFTPAPGHDGARICFSLGVLVADAKAAVARTVAFSEGELLKWAKRAARNAGYRDGGTIAFLVVPTADQIPGDLDDFQQTMYYREGATFPVCLTLRPVTAAELGFLLDRAARLREAGFVGALGRMAAAFVRGEPRVAVLYYLYQKARERKGRDDGGFTALLEDTRERPPTLADLDFAGRVLGTRRPFGGEPVAGGRETYFAPLVDLAELVKVLE